MLYRQGSARMGRKHRLRAPVAIGRSYAKERDPRLE